MIELPVIGVDFYRHALPIISLLVGSLLLLLFAVNSILADRRVIFVATLTFLCSALLSSVWLMGSQYQAFGGALTIDAIAVFGHLYVLVVAIGVCLLFWESYLAERFWRGDIACIFLLTVAGMLVLVSSTDILTIFVGLETFSLGIYALIGYVKKTQPAQEAAIKYFILGSFAAALLLFGFALLYAGSGSLVITQIATTDNELFARIGAVFIGVGLAFKLALVPCHLWTPDAYQGAPTPMTALMAITVKAAIILLALRFITAGMAVTWLLPILTLFACASMLVGNLMALSQRNVKRMLAYSSIAHGGYLAMALVAVGNHIELANAVLYYLLAYGLLALGAFAIITWLESEEREHITMDNLRALGMRHPYVSLALAVFMLAFAGIPPTVGFFAKLSIFQAAMISELYLLLIVGVVGSAISFYYYLRVILLMYFDNSAASEAQAASGLHGTSKPLLALITIALMGALVLGIVMHRQHLPSLTHLQHVRK
ncbi:MAG: NADH-quinone oxidoreductase subunit N [Pseudomonadota bacterium]|nr:NADH-quinone oxidoreductase subunit N [Pseudomonadota bacterium]